MQRFRRGIVVAGSLGLVAALLIAAPFSDGSPATASAQPAATDASSGIEVARQLSTAFESVADQSRPSVVSIISTGRVQREAVQSPFRGHNPFEEFFGNDFFDRFRAPDGGQRLRQGQGSGVIVTDDGYVLTNNHVVENADEVMVRLSDEREYEADVVGTDPKTDLAVLKIDADDLTPARLGDSDELRVGEWVVAAGNPFGLTSSVTAGIVSAIGRSGVGITDYEDFIQTDAAINPGNSGGPLLDLDGDVVGINTAILTRSGGSMGVGFAIPANMARHVMDSLIENGHVVRGWLGVNIQALTPELAQSFGFDGTNGVLVADVNDGTPAARAGLRSGDIIVAYGGEPLSTMERFRTDVAATRPGTEVAVEIVRDGRERSLDVEIGELETDARVALGEAAGGAELGITVQELTPAIARELNLDDDVHGVVVSAVDPMSAAARAGVRRGDVIEDVLGNDVSSVGEFRDALADAAGSGPLRLAVLRGGTRIYVVLQHLS